MATARTTNITRTQCTGESTKDEEATHPWFVSVSPLGQARAVANIIVASHECAPTLERRHVFSGEHKPLTFVTPVCETLMPVAFDP